MGSFTSHKNKSVKVLRDGTHGFFRPYPRRLESLTICRCHFKGALPTEVARLISANFSYLWKFEHDVPNRFGEIPFEKPQNLQRMYRLINVLPPSNFAVFNCCYFFFLLLIAKSKNVNNDFTMNPPITLAANETHLPFAAYRERNSRSDWNCWGDVVEESSR